jgi:hypothetical protein
VVPLNLASSSSRTAVDTDTPLAPAAKGNALEEAHLSELSATAFHKTPLNRRSGGTYLDIQVVKVGLKDAASLVNPTIVVSVYDREASRMEESKETAIGFCEEPKHVDFDKATIQLETALERMEERTQYKQAAGPVVFPQSLISLSLSLCWCRRCRRLLGGVSLQTQEAQEVVSLLGSNRTRRAKTRRRVQHRDQPPSGDTVRTRIVPETDGPEAQALQPVHSERTLSPPPSTDCSGALMVN